MNKKNIKKVSSLTVAGVMALQILPGIVSAKNYKQNRVVIDSFNSFTTYIESKDSQDNVIMPDGFKVSTDGKSSASFGAYKDSESGNNAFSLGWLAKAVYSFPEAITTGKLRVTFDVLTNANNPETTSTPNLWVRSHYLDIDTTQNVEDYYYHLDSNGNEKDSKTYVVGEKMMTLFRVGKNNLYHYGLGTGHGNPVSAVADGRVSVSDGSVKGKGMVGDGAWHKADILIDFDQKVATFKYDGIEVYKDITIPGTGGMKDVFLLSDSNGVVAVDNWYINHYFDESDNKGLMEGTYNAEDESMTLVFSEFLSRDLSADDFIILNADGENVIPDSVNNYTNSSVKLNFKDLSGGVYTIKCKNNIFYNQTKPENSINFAVNKFVDVANDKKYFINEDFEGYGGGMPVDWYSLTDEIPVASLEKSEHDGGNALKIDSQNPIAYGFKDSLMNGIYHIEFDVKNGNGWYMHLLDTAMTDSKWCKDNESQWIYQEDYNRLYEEYKAAQGIGYTDAGWDAYIKDSTQDALRKSMLQATKKKTVVLGQEGSSIKYNKGRASNLANATELKATGSDKWTKVLITLDFNNGSYYYKIGNGETEKATFASLSMATDGSVDQSGTLRYDRIALVNHETLLREFVHGVGGIGFTALGDKPLEIDNVKVYSDNSYNFYEDFNTVQSNGIIRRTVQPGWYNLQFEGYGKYGYSDVASGSNRNIGIGNIDCVFAGNANSIDGTASELLYTQGPIVGLFETPIKLGSEFAIELDWRNFGTNTLYVGIVDDANTYSRAKNTKTAKTGHPATGEIPTGADALYNYYAILRACKFGFSYWEPHEYRSLSTSEATVKAQKLLDAVGVGVWHLKYNVKTNSTGFLYQLTVTSQDGKTSYTSEWVEQPKMFTYTMNDIVGIALGGSNSFVDNIKVYEVNPCEQPFVITYSATYPEGESVLDNTISACAQSVNIQLSAPVDSTDGICVKYSDGEPVLCDLELVNNNKTVKVNFTKALTAGKTITIGISQFTKITGAKYSGGIKTTSKSFEVLESNGKLDISEFRLYEKIGGNQLYFNYHATDRPDDLRVIQEGWYPVLAEELTKKEPENMKVVIKGYNYGEAVDLLAMLAGYDSNSTTLKQRVTEKITVDKGAFEAEIDIKQLTDKEITRIKAFLWDQNTYGPRAEDLDYNYR